MSGSIPPGPDDEVPPPPGGFTPPQPGPPPAGPTGPGPSATPYSVSDAFNYGWKKFQENLGPWILGVLILFLGLAVVQVVYNLVVGGLLDTFSTTTVDPRTGDVFIDETGGLAAALVGALVLAVPVTILGMIVQAQIVRGGLATCEGRIELGRFFDTSLLGPIVVASIIAGLMTLAGVIACYVGAVVVAFFVQFFAYFVLDREARPWESIKASFSFVNQHQANIIVLFLASALAVLIGALLCGVGLLVAYPVVAIAHAYTYKVLNGEEVVA